jgi:hypothetical protein
MRVSVIVTSRMGVNVGGSVGRERTVALSVGVKEGCWLAVGVIVGVSVGVAVTLAVGVTEGCWLAVGVVVAVAMAITGTDVSKVEVSLAVGVTVGGTMPLVWKLEDNTSTRLTKTIKPINAAIATPITMRLRGLFINDSPLRSGYPPHYG